MSNILRNTYNNSWYMKALSRYMLWYCFVDAIRAFFWTILSFLTVINYVFVLTTTKILGFHYWFFSLSQLRNSVTYVMNIGRITYSLVIDISINSDGAIALEKMLWINFNYPYLCKANTKGLKEANKALTRLDWGDESMFVWLLL